MSTFYPHEFVLMPRRPRPRADVGEPAVIPPAEPIDFETVPAPAYAARATARDDIARDYPWLESEWLVDIGDGPSDFDAP